MSSRQLQAPSPSEIMLHHQNKNTPNTANDPPNPDKAASHAKESENAWHRSFAGGAAGFTSRMVVAPFDVIKIRFQTQIDTVLPFPSKHPVTASTTPCVLSRRPSIGAREPKYRSVTQALKTVWKEEGIVGLWRGSLPGLLLWVSYASVQFPLYAYLKETFKMPENANKFTHTGYNLGYGGCAAIGATMVTYPFDLIRTRFVSQGVPPQHPTLVSLVKGIAYTHGPPGFYRGLFASLVQVAPNMALTFAIYEELSDFGSRIGYNNSGLSGLIAGTVAKLFVYPLDTVKKRLQVFGLKRDISYGPLKDYRGAMHCAKSMFYREGFKAFYKGLVPSLLKTGISTGVTFWTYDFVQQNM